MARKYEYYFRVVKTLSFTTRENNIHIFKLPFNVLFIIWSEVGTSEISREITCVFHALHIFFISSLSENLKNTSVKVITI